MVPELDVAAEERRTGRSWSSPWSGAPRSGIGRRRIEVVESASEHPCDSIARNVSPGSTVVTDAHRGYPPTLRPDHIHECHNLAVAGGNEPARTVAGRSKHESYGEWMSAGWTGLDKWTRGWLLASVVFGAGLLVAAFTVSAYDGTVSQTLVQANGGKVIFIVAIPLVGAFLAIWTIVARLSHARSGVGILTWLVIGVLGMFALLGLLTIGPFVAPVPVCLLVAALRIQEIGRAKS